MMHSREIVRRLRKDGWYHTSTVGDHWHFKHPVKPGKVTVPHPTKDMPIKNIKSIERQSGLTLRT